MLLLIIIALLSFFFFFFNDTATTEIYTLSLHYALPISSDNEVICPMYLNPSGNNKINNMISLKEYLNKDITLSYRQIEAKNEKEIVVTNVFNDKFK